MVDRAVERLFITLGFVVVLLSACGGSGDCPDMACMQVHFSECEPASLTVKAARDATVQYKILGPENTAGCRVAVSYVDSPNPDWAGKRLTLTLRDKLPFEAAVQAGLSACMAGTDNAVDYNCEGGLLETFRTPGARPEQT